MLSLRNELTVSLHHGKTRKKRHCFCGNNEFHYDLLCVVRAGSDQSWFSSGISVHVAQNLGNCLRDGNNCHLISCAANPQIVSLILKPIFGFLPQIFAFFFHSMFCFTQLFTI